MYHIDGITYYRVVRREGTVFTGVCLSTSGGVTPSPSHNTSTGPMSFLGGYPSDWSHVPAREYPGWGTPWPGMGYPPGIGQQMEYFDMWRWYASCVHAGGLSCLDLISANFTRC